MRTLREALYASSSTRDACTRIFDKVYNTDIQRLLSMEDMWVHRTKPAPLDLERAMSTPLPDETNASTTSMTLRDRRPLSLSENAALFLSSAEALVQRAKDSPLSFDKDDDDALGFVTAAANLRAHVYHIAEQTRFETKQIAGNIIPAIATTNAIISALVVIQALHMLAARWDQLRVVSLARRATRLFTSFPPAPPQPQCGVCQDVYMRVGIDPAHTTLQDVLEGVRTYLGYDEDAFVSISAGTRILYDPDLDDNVGKRLSDLRVQIGDVLAVADEDGQLATAQWILERSPEGQPLYVAHAVTLPRRAAVPMTAESDDDEIVEVDQAHLPKKRARDDTDEPPAKRTRPAAPAPSAASEDVIVLD